MTLDFAQAILSWPALQIDVQAHNGSVTLVTRPGIMVDTDDLEIRHSTVKVLAPWDPDVPVRFRIDVAGTVDVSTIKARPPRRTLSAAAAAAAAPAAGSSAQPPLTRGAGPDLHHMPERPSCVIRPARSQETQERQSGTRAVPLPANEDLGVTRPFPGTPERPAWNRGATALTVGPRLERQAMNAVIRIETSNPGSSTPSLAT